MRLCSLVFYLVQMSALGLAVLNRQSRRRVLSYADRVQSSQRALNTGTEPPEINYSRQFLLCVGTVEESVFLSLCFALEIQLPCLVLHLNRQRS